MIKMEEKKVVEMQEKKSSNIRIAVILIRGLVGIRHDIKNALFTLNLRKKHSCSIINDNKSNRAILQKCKDYITFGEISKETYAELVNKRGKKDKKGNLKKFFSLHPPRGGFERKGIKKPFNLGGVLGNRKEKINDIIKKML